MDPPAQGADQAASDFKETSNIRLLHTASSYQLLLAGGASITADTDSRQSTTAAIHSIQLKELTVVGQGQSIEFPRCWRQTGYGWYCVFHSTWNNITHIQLKGHRPMNMLIFYWESLDMLKSAVHVWHFTFKTHTIIVKNQFLFYYFFFILPWNSRQAAWNQ